MTNIKKIKNKLFLEFHGFRFKSAIPRIPRLFRNRGKSLALQPHPWSTIFLTTTEGNPQNNNNSSCRYFDNIDQLQITYRPINKLIPMITYLLLQSYLSAHHNLIIVLSWMSIWVRPIFDHVWVTLITSGEHNRQTTLRTELLIQTGLGSIEIPYPIFTKASWYKAQKLKFHTVWCKVVELKLRR